MSGKRPEKFDKRPKRRRAEDNPYQLLTAGKDSDCPQYYLRFTDGNGEEQLLEIQKELFDTLDQMELRDLSRMNREDKYRERSELSEETLHKRAIAPTTSAEDVALPEVQNQALQEAIFHLPKIQRRRLTLYYFCNLTYEKIGRMEGCSKVAVKYSIDRALAKLNKILVK